MNKRLQLILLVLLFFGPLAVAWIWFFHFQDIRPEPINHGDLIEPVVPIADLKLYERESGIGVTPLTDDWSIVLFAPDACDVTCERALYLSRQVHIRLNRDADRVQRVLIAGSDVEYPVAEHPDLRVFDADERVIARFSDPAREALAGSDRMYLVDPRGNLMMSYPLDFTPEMLSDDLERLLRYSNDE